MSQNSPRPAWLIARQWRRFVAFAVVCGAAGLAACGCSSESILEFDELDLIPVQEELSEFPLGHYSIPIPFIAQYHDNKVERRNRIELEFDLHVVVPPHQESLVAEAWERHQGKIRDRIIRICRNASIDDLQEPELATLKSRLADALQAQLGSKGSCRLVITEVVSQEI